MSVHEVASVRSVKLGLSDVLALIISMPNQLQKFQFEELRIVQIEIGQNRKERLGLGFFAFRESEGQD